MADKPHANQTHAQSERVHARERMAMHAAETSLHDEHHADAARGTLPSDASLRAYAQTDVQDGDAPAANSVPIAGDLLADRYRLVRVLGTGAFGRVFYAWDEERAQGIAIKVLKNTHPQALLHFKREFRSISEIRHPNLVRVFQLVRDGDTWFIVMEMLEGVPFVPYRLLARHRAHDDVPNTCRSIVFTAVDTAAATHTEVLHRLRAEGDGRVLRHKAPLLSPAQIQDYFYQLASGVHALHRKHVVHCDLKPSNIMVTPQGRVVVLDFGVVRHMLHLAAQNKDEGIFAGTRYYVAPEATTTSSPTSSFDWYAVGVILWQFVIIHSAEHLGGMREAERARYLHQAAETFPAYAPLYSLCEALLRQDPDARAGFDAIEAVCAPAAPEGAPSKAGEMRAEQGGGLYGREAALAQLHEAWHAFNHGKAQALLIDGHAGNGKTALVEAFLHEVQATHASTRVLLAQCQSNESVGFRAFDEIVDGLCALIAAMPEDEREEVLPFCTPTLCELFPVLRSLDGRLNEPASRHLFMEDPRFALRDLLCNVAQRYAMVIWIEDIECVDDDSLQWIGQIFTPALRPNTFLLITKNTRGVLHQDRYDIETLGYAIERIPLPALDDEAARALVQTWLSPSVVQRQDVVERILTIGAGRPQMLRTLCSQDLDLSDLPSNVQGTHLLARRIAKLPKAQRDILAVAAVSSRPLPHAVFAYITKQTPEVLDASMDALMDAFLLRYAIAGNVTEYEIVHDDVRQSVWVGLSDETIRRLHAAFVDAENALPQFRMRALTLLWHLLEAGETARAYTEGRRLAALAEHHGAYATAAQIYNQLLDMPQIRSMPDHILLRERAVALNIQAGNLLQAANLLAALAREAIDDDERRTLYARAEETYLLCGHVEKAIEQRTLRKHTQKQRRLPMPKPPRLLHIAWLKERLIRRIENLDLHTLRGAENADLRAQGSYVFRMPGLDMGLVDPILGLELSMRALNAALDSGQRIPISRALAGVSPIFAAASKTDQKRGQQWTRLAIALAEKAEDPVSEHWARICQANIDYQMGDYPLAWKKLRFSTAWLQKNASSQSMMIAYANSHLIYCAWAMGKVDDLRAAYYGQLGDVRGWQNQMLEAAITIGGFNTWLLDDVPQAGRLALQQLDIPHTGGPFRLLDFFTMYYGAEIALYTQDYPQICATIPLLVRFETTILARMLEQVRNAARFLLARLLMARATHEGQLQDRRLYLHLQLIARRLRRSSEPLGIGWGHQVLGASYLFQKNQRKADLHYQRAIEHFERSHIAIFGAPTRAAAIAAGVIRSDEDPYQELRQMGVVDPQKYTRVGHPYIEAYRG